ncbi:hypothetical protein [Streptomyces goshikiensis]
MTRQGSTATAILFTPSQFGREASPADPTRSLVQDWFPDLVAAAEQLLDGLVWAEGGYTGSLVGWCWDQLALTLETVLCVERVVCGGGGRVLEALRVVGAAARVELHYDELPLTGGVV